MILRRQVPKAILQIAKNLFRSSSLKRLTGLLYFTSDLKSTDKTDGVTIRDSIGRDQNPVPVNEFGFYSLILSSKLPAARRFWRWVTGEVLPIIRHGLYAIYDILANPDLSFPCLTRVFPAHFHPQDLYFSQNCFTMFI